MLVVEHVGEACLEHLTRVKVIVLVHASVCRRGVLSSLSNTNYRQDRDSAREKLQRKIIDIAYSKFGISARLWLPF